MNYLNSLLVKSGVKADTRVKVCNTAGIEV